MILKIKTNLTSNITLLMHYLIQYLEYIKIIFINKIIFKVYLNQQNQIFLLYHLLSFLNNFLEAV